MCRRYEANETDILNMLVITEDPRADDNNPMIENREQFNPLGQLILKDFENGVLSIKQLADWARAKGHYNANRRLLPRVRWSI